MVSNILNTSKHWGLVLAVSFSWLSACGLGLDWGDTGRPCDGAFECNEGYSCLVSKVRCVADKSLLAGDDCSSDAQCSAGTVCVDALCVSACASERIFRPDEAACLASEFCGLAENVHGSLVVACRSSQCTADKECGSGKGCVPTGTNVNACLPGCAVQFNSGSYSDNCVAPDLVCQPVGHPQYARLVCLPRGDAILGEPCLPGIVGCTSGLVCINRSCFAYCESPTDCTGDDLCLQFESMDKLEVFSACGSF